MTEHYYKYRWPKVPNPSQQTSDFEALAEANFDQWASNADNMATEVTDARADFDDVDDRIDWIESGNFSMNVQSVSGFYTAKSGDQLLAAAGATIFLPSTPQPWDRIDVVCGGDYTTTALIINPNYKPIHGETFSYWKLIHNHGFSLIYRDDGFGWGSINFHDAYGVMDINWEEARNAYDCPWRYKDYTYNPQDVRDDLRSGWNQYAVIPDYQDTRISTHFDSGNAVLGDYVYTTSGLMYIYVGTWQIWLFDECYRRHIDSLESEWTYYSQLEAPDGGMHAAQLLTNPDTNTLYLIGGKDLGGTLKYNVYTANEVSNNWNYRGTFPKGIANNTYWLKKDSQGNWDELWSFGGEVSTGKTNDIYVADAETPWGAYWQYAGALPIAVDQQWACCDGTYLYLMGGQTATGETDMIMSAPLTDLSSWSDTGVRLPDVMHSNGGEPILVNNSIYLPNPYIDGWQSHYIGVSLVTKVAKNGFMFHEKPFKSTVTEQRMKMFMTDADRLFMVGSVTVERA
jgi:hypothetical protein